MLHVDLDLIAPSSRDLLRALSTRRRSVALVASMTEPGSATTREATVRAEVARLEELGVSALGFREASLAMQAGASAARSAPILGLANISDRDALRRARCCGADGVCISLFEGLGTWEALAPQARTLRMSPIALVCTEMDARRAEQVGARAALVRGAQVEQVLELARSLPRRMVILADVSGADGAALRSRRGHVDAALVSSALHAEPEFVDVVAEVDP